MLQMLKKWLLSNQNNDNLGKINDCIAFVISNVFKWLLQRYAATCIVSGSYNTGFDRL